MIMKDISKASKKYKLTESQIRQIVMNSANRIIKESCDMSKYTHFALNKKTGKIGMQWDYKGHEESELKAGKREYFIIDLEDNDKNPKDYTILTKKGLEKKGIDPCDTQNYEG